MAKRITIMIEDSLDKKVRRYQAKRLQKENATFSYSKAINEILRRSI